MAERIVRGARGRLLLVALAIGGCTAVSPSATPAITSPVPSAAVPSSEVSLPPATEPPASPAASGGLASDPLHALVLRDVRSGERFTLGLLASEKPLLLEPMAIWCSNCRAQQREVVAAHGLADFHSVSLDIDPSEIASDLVEYADREGFDWRFAMANADLACSLRERFGSAAIFPTAMPKILFRTDGSVELIGLGQQLSAQELAAVISG